MNLAFTQKFLTMKVIVPIIVLVGSMAVAIPAFAHAIYEDGYTYASDHDCAWNRAEISHGSGGGYAKSDITAKVKGVIVRVRCYDYFPRPANYLKNRYKLYRWNGSSWSLCRSTSWHYNSRETAKLVIYKNYGSTPPCGAGEYKTEGFGYFKNGTWKGGSIESGNSGHTLPD